MSKKINIGKLLFVLSIPIVLISLYLLATKTNEHDICNEVRFKFNYETEQPLLNEANIYKILGMPLGSKNLIGKSSNMLNFNAMEKKLLAYSTIKKAEIYLGMSGILKVDITERNPILRVMPVSKLGYYICDDGVKIPLSSNFSPNVIPATGFMNDKIDRKIYCIVRFVNNNSFWKDQIQQLFVSENQDISFVPTIGVHEVILGDTNNLEMKFNKLDLFYKKGLSKIGWDKYKSINLKYKGQVICK